MKIFLLLLGCLSLTWSADTPWQLLLRKLSAIPSFQVSWTTDVVHDGSVVGQDRHEVICSNDRYRYAYVRKTPDGTIKTKLLVVYKGETTSNDERTLMVLDCTSKVLTLSNGRPQGLIWDPIIFWDGLYLSSYLSDRRDDNGKTGVDIITGHTIPELEKRIVALKCITDDSVNSTIKVENKGISTILGKYNSLGQLDSCKVTSADSETPPIEYIITKREAVDGFSGVQLPMAATQRSFRKNGEVLFEYRHQVEQVKVGLTNDELADVFDIDFTLAQTVFDAITHKFIKQ